MFRFQMKLLSWFFAFCFLLFAFCFSLFLFDTCSYNTLIKMHDIFHFLLSQNHFVMEEIVLDNAPNDCISCVRYGKESDLLLVSSWDAVIVLGINLRLVDYTL